MPGSGYVARFQDVYYYSKDKNMENETMPVGGDAVEVAVAKAPRQLWYVVLSVVMALIGLGFIVLCERHMVSTTVVCIGGVAFIIPGVALLLSLMAQRKERQRGSILTYITMICGLAAIALGVVILVAPDNFTNLLVYLFGGLLIVSAAWQFDVMVRRNRGTAYPVWLTMAPIVLVALGVVMCTMDVFKGASNEKWMLLATGIGFTISGLIGLCTSYYVIRTAHNARQALDSRPAPAPEKPSEGAETSEKASSAD